MMKFWALIEKAMSWELGQETGSCHSDVYPHCIAEISPWACALPGDRGCAENGGDRRRVWGGSISFDKKRFVAFLTRQCLYKFWEKVCLHRCVKICVFVYGIGRVLGERLSSYLQAVCGFACCMFLVPLHSGHSRCSCLCIVQETVPVRAEWVSRQSWIVSLCQLWCCFLRFMHYYRQRTPDSYWIHTDSATVVGYKTKLKVAVRRSETEDTSQWQCLNVALSKYLLRLSRFSGNSDHSPHQSHSDRTLGICVAILAFILAF